MQGSQVISEPNATMEDVSLSAEEREQLATLWSEGCSPSRHGFPDPSDERWSNDSFYCDDFTSDDVGVRLEGPARQERLKQFKRELLSSAGDPITHFKSLSSGLQRQAICRYQDSPLNPSISGEVAVARAAQLLSRLPAVPSRIALTSLLWGDPGEVKHLERFLNEDTTFVGRNQPVNMRLAWAQLQVVSRTSSVILQLALLVTTAGNDRYSLALSIRSFVDFVSELIDTNAEQEGRQPRHVDVVRNSILDAFLWTTWQRSLMLLYWFVMKTHLALGYNRKWDAILSLRGCGQLLNPSVRETLYGSANQSHESMCQWAFTLLRSSRASLGLDFRRFHVRFSSLHSGKRARCQFDVDEPCDGSHPLRCGRFLDKRLVREEQSLHDEACAGKCDRLVWQETSYTSIKGPVAVSLEPHRKVNITYCAASNQTLAISHVWSHGQGSRPHEGINKCLHQKYASIARAHGCTSYWIDSMCIPAAHDLRAEAIGYINRIFADSKVVLVCDRDLMDIDIANLDRNRLESLLVTVFVSDWSVRAWTLLEAMKGSHALHILCKHNRTISLYDVMSKVHNSGSVDIAVLALSVQHLVPSSTDAFRRSSSRQSTEVAASLLSHRHATREGDDVVIWSLLSSTAVYQDAAALWKAKIGHQVATAYLLSNSPRVEGVRGFSWAPRTPYVRPDHRSSSSADVDVLGGPYNPFEGGASELGTITRRGLRAEWLVYRVSEDDGPAYRDGPCTMTKLSASGERETVVLEGHRIRNFCWEAAEKLLGGEHESVVLLQPLAYTGSSRAYDASGNRGETHGRVLAICASKDGERWSWAGVQAWPSSIPLPAFLRDEMLIE